MSTHCVLTLIQAQYEMIIDISIFILLPFIIFRITASVTMISDNTDNLFFLLLFLSRRTVFYCKLKTDFSILSICYIVKMFQPLSFTCSDQQISSTIFIQQEYRLHKLGYKHQTICRHVKHWKVLTWYCKKMFMQRMYFFHISLYPI